MHALIAPTVGARGTPGAPDSATSEHTRPRATPGQSQSPDFCLHRRALVFGAATTALGLARAQDWPVRPIHLVVPFAPGGLNDNMARLLAPLLQRELGQPVIIDNKAGGGGKVGAGEVARATPDGYTLLIATPPLTIGPSFMSKMPYDPERITPLAFMGRVPNVLLVNPSSGINSVADLIQRAGKSAGKLTFASPGTGTSPHLSGELMNVAAGAALAHRPCKGSAAAVKALLAGEVDACFDNLSSVINPIASGNVKALAVTTRKRSKILPDVPSLAGSGMPDVEVSAWFGLAAPAGLPASVIARVEAAMSKILSNRDLLGEMARSGAEALFMNGAVMAGFMATDAVRWKRLASATGITLE